ncbi:MAG: FkbM family methyltransferase [Chloroflexi bacterium]|nr:FkbM family methyltransferase [Chloroflexota bacterium]
MRNVLDTLKAKPVRGACANEQGQSDFQQLVKLLGSAPRYQPGRISIPGWNLSFVDAASLLSNFEVIVVKRRNDFVSSRRDPRILDCGSNIGISVLHYKHIFPEAQITAFEPDPQVCQVLRRNLLANDVSEVDIVEAAVWKDDSRHWFSPDGADAGKIVDMPMESRDAILVKTVRLADYLSDGTIDFVKMDIEGAEAEVIVDCGGLLKNVRSMVIEYHYRMDHPQELAATINTLAGAGFRLSFNSYGRWLDMSYGKHPLTDDELGIDQFFLICAWRSF